jgi:XTP/dITP diphosphohydrolase
VQHLIVATRNTHKTREIERILGPSFAVCDLSDHPEISETVESGKTFEENASLKAVTVSRQVAGLVVADDSGLEVDVLGGAPGIYSARYAGATATDKEKIDKLLSELVKLDAKGNQRHARFRCVFALARGGQILRTFEGIVEGRIANQARGSNGFGYDPIFLPTGSGQTFGELAPAEKDRWSHRARALEKLRAFLILRPDQQEGNRDL